MNKPNKTTLQRLLSIALPMVVSQASDSIMMFVDRVFLSRVGELHLAASMAGAVTIAFNWDIVAFIPMLGMSQATTALVAQNIGAGDREEAKRSTYVALRAALGLLRGSHLPDSIYPSGSRHRLGSVHRIRHGVGAGDVPALPQRQVAADRAHLLTACLASCYKSSIISNHEIIAKKTTEDKQAPA